MELSQLDEILFRKDMLERLKNDPAFYNQVSHYR
jgi:hypothetical protein